MMRNLIHKITNNNIFWMILSLILAMLTWAYVTSNEVTERTETFSGIQLEFVGEETMKESRGLIVTEVSRSDISIRLTGSRRNISRLSSENIKATIDLSSISRSGYYTQLVTITYPNDVDTTDIRVVSRTPQSISFTVDKLNSKTIELVGNFTGSVAEGYVAKPIEFSPETVKISGPEEELSKVAYAYVAIDRDGVDKTLSYETSYDLVDVNGQKLDLPGIELSTETVNVTLPVAATKVVPLAVDFIEGGGATSTDVLVTIEPVDAVMLTGDSEILEGLNKITLGTIDLSSFEHNYEKKFPIVINDELQNNSGVTEVTVKVEIRGLESKRLTVTNITGINLPEGLKADISTLSVDVIVRGIGREIESVESNNIRAVVDFSQFAEGEGSFNLPLTFYIDGFTHVGVVGQYSAFVHIE